MWLSLGFVLVSCLVGRSHPTRSNWREGGLIPATAEGVQPSVVGKAQLQDHEHWACWTCSQEAKTRQEGGACCTTTAPIPMTRLLQGSSTSQRFHNLPQHCHPLRTKCSNTWSCAGLCWLALCQLDSSWSHLRRVIYNRGNSTIILDCRQVL